MIVRAIGITSEEVFAATLPAGRAAMVSALRMTHGSMPRPASRRAPGPGATTATPLGQLVEWLVLSADPQTRAVVLGAIRRNGVSGRAAPLRRRPCRAGAAYRCRYAFIDLTYPIANEARLDAWIREFQLQHTRLVFRGTDGAFGQERWARERGAVAYLPGRLVMPGLSRLVGELSTRSRPPDGPAASHA